MLSGENDRNIIVPLFCSKYLSNDVLTGIGDYFLNPPDVDFKMTLLEHYERTNVLHKRDFGSTTLFALGVDSAWKLMIWIDILDYVFLDPIVKQLSLTKKCFFLNHAELKEPCVRIMGNANVNPLPLQMAWRYEKVSKLVDKSKDVVFDMIMNRIHTYIIGLSTHFCDYVFGWDMNTSQFALFNFSFAHHEDTRNENCHCQRDEETAEMMDILFPDIQNCSFMFAKIVEIVLKSKKDVIQENLKKLTLIVNSVIFVAVYSTFGFKNLKKELDACRKRIICLSESL